MKKIFILALCLIAGTVAYAAKSQNDTLTIVNRQAKVIVSRKTKQMRRCLTFMLSDKRMIEIYDRNREEDFSDRGILYDYDEDKKSYIQSHRFDTNFEPWEKSICGKKVIVRTKNQKCKCYLH